MKAWRGRPIACIASGPSLTLADCDAARHAGCVTIVTNTTFRLCPWADALYGFDVRWWRAYLSQPTPDGGPAVRDIFPGRRLTQTLTRISRDVECVRSNQRFRSFGNSGANAISLAVLHQASVVLMMGYDCGFDANGRSHHHGDHPEGFPNCTTLPSWPQQFERLAGYAQRRGVPVINVSRETALTCFPRMTLERAIHDHVDGHQRCAAGLDLRSATGEPAEIRPQTDH